jgi:hypothetical protein
MDSRARSPDGTVQYRLEQRQQSASRFRTLVTALDAIEGSQLLRACRKHLRSEIEQTNPGHEDVLGTRFAAPMLERAWSQTIGRR